MNPLEEPHPVAIVKLRTFGCDPYLDRRLLEAHVSHCELRVRNNHQNTAADN